MKAAYFFYPGFNRNLRFGAIVFHSMKKYNMVNNIFGGIWR